MATAVMRRQVRRKLRALAVFRIDSGPAVAFVDDDPMIRDHPY
jgi:hypothetical protein